MPDFSCAAAGADSCGWKASNSDPDKLVAEVAAHLTEKHNVQHVTGTLAKYATAVALGEATLTND